MFSRTDVRCWTALIVSTFLLCAPPAWAAEYYLSPEGDDEAAGDRQNPWRTIARANETLEAGDTAVFLPGEYAGTISPVNSGTADAPITYRSAEPRAARLVRADAEAEHSLITLIDREHIIVDGFLLQAPPRSAHWVRARHSSHFTIRNCTMRGARLGAVGILHCTQVRLLDNVFSADRNSGGMVDINESSEVLVEGNSFTRVGHHQFEFNNCNNIIVRANVFRGEWGRNYVMRTTGRAVTEGNILTRGRDSAGSNVGASHIHLTHHIFRHNRIFGNLHYCFFMGSYVPPGRWGAAPTGLHRAPFVTVDCRFYHNTFDDNLGVAFIMSGINISANVFQNNIFHRNDWAGGHLHIDRRQEVTRDNRFTTNLFFGDEPGQALIRHGSNYWTVEEANERTPMMGGYFSEFHGNIDVAPGFVDAENRDYRLRPDSPAINAGTPLALAIGSGTGRVLPVTDGIPFHDGLGIEGEEGDWIAVGAGDNIAQIQRLEWRYYQPALLHLDREVTWEDAMPVSLPWVGEAPDIGAYEHGLEHPTRLIALARPVVAAPGEPVQFSLDTLGKEVESVVWDFEDGTLSYEEAPVHAYAEVGHYGVTVRATFTNGRRAVDALFVMVQEPRGPDTPLVDVDFEDATFDNWAPVFKFYRPRQTGSAHVQREDGEGKCMRLFYDESPVKQNRTAGELAPGAWDVDEYPLVRFQYRIPEGVPVAVEFRPFSAPGRPGSFVLAGTVNQAHRFGELEGYTLVDDGQWREITMDVRRIRDVFPELRHLRQFLFSTHWSEPPAPPEWMHFPALQSEFRSRPAGPEDTARLHGLDIVLLRARQPGAWLEMPFSLQDEVTGEVFADLLDHDSRGTVQISLNGEVMVEEYDHHTEGISRESVPLGAMTLPAGDHTLRVEVTDRQVGFVGLIGVTVRPEGAPAAPEIAVEDFEFWFDNFAIMPDEE